MQDAENSYLAEGLTEAGAVEELTGSSITYRIAVGPHKGRPVYRLQSLPAAQPEEVQNAASENPQNSVRAREIRRNNMVRLTLAARRLVLVMAKNSVYASYTSESPWH